MHGVGAERGVALAARDARRRRRRARRRPRARPSIAAAYQVGSTSPPPPCRRRIAASAIQAAASTRMAASPERREVLRLAVPVGVLVIGRPLGDSDRVQGQQGGRRVHARVHRLGKDAEAAGEKADEQLDGDESQRRAEREERGAPCHRHLADRTRPVRRPPRRLGWRAVNADVAIRPSQRSDAADIAALFAPSASTSRPGIRAASPASTRARDNVRGSPPSSATARRAPPTAS